MHLRKDSIDTIQISQIVSLLQGKENIRFDSMCTWHTEYGKSPKNSVTRTNVCNYSKIVTICFYHWIMRPNDADGMANSVDTDQTAPLSGSTLFA